MHRLMLVVFALFFLFLSAAANSAENEKLRTRTWENKSIVVGVRDDARPFSYRTLTKDQETILPGYGGYMIEICRRVLLSITRDSKGPFSGYTVEAKSVNASERFNDLKSNKIDLLCGPNSITLDRLELYNASLPLFLSGITFATVIDEKFPRKKNDCVAVLGFLANTTAQSEGLRKIAEQDFLQLYDSVLEDYLALAPSVESSKTPAISLSDLTDRVSLLTSNTKERTGASGKNPPIRQNKIFVPTCMDGYGSSAGPIVYYDRHQDGINDLCAGRLLFYVADIDIMKYLLESTPGCKSSWALHHETLTREAYAVFFRRPRSLDEANSHITGLLFSEFNNELQQKMQTIEGVLMYEFNREFTGVEPTNELKQFFSAFQFIKDQ